MQIELLEYLHQAGGVHHIDLCKFFTWLDNCISAQAEYRDGSGNNPDKILGALATQNVELARKVLAMHGVRQGSINATTFRMPEPEDPVIERVVRKIYQLFPQDEIQMVFDSMVTLSNHARPCAEDKRDWEINPSEILRERLHSVIVDYIRREKGEPPLPIENGPEPVGALSTH